MNNPFPKALVEWSAEQLEVSPQTQPEEIRAAALRALAESDFMPSDAWQHACEVLLEPPHPGEETQVLQGRQAAMHDAADRLRSEVENFATKFFELPWAERDRTYRELLKTSEEFPAIRARLKRLSPGLTLDGSELANDDKFARDVADEARRLAIEAQALFVLPPVARAIARRRAYARYWESPDRFRTAATWLDRQSPLWKPLGRYLDGFDEAVEMHRAAQRGLGRMFIDTNATAPRRATSTGESNFRWIFWLGPLVVALGRLASCNSTPEYRQPTYGTRYYSPPAREERNDRLPATQPMNRADPQEQDPRRQEAKRRVQELIRSGKISPELESTIRRLNPGLLPPENSTGDGSPTPPPGEGPPSASPDRSAAPAIDPTPLPSPPSSTVP